MCVVFSSVLFAFLYVRFVCSHNNMYFVFMYVCFVLLYMCFVFPYLRCVCSSCFLRIFSVYQSRSGGWATTLVPGVYCNTTTTTSCSRLEPVDKPVAVADQPDTPGFPTSRATTLGTPVPTSPVSQGRG